VLEPATRPQLVGPEKVQVPSFIAVPLEYLPSEMQDCFSMVKYIPKAQTHIRHGGTHFYELKFHEA
jgi:hypothetical protein